MVAWPQPSMLLKTGIMLFLYAPENVPLCSDYAPIMPHTNPHTKWNPHTNLHTNGANTQQYYFHYHFAGMLQCRAMTVRITGD